MNDPKLTEAEEYIQVLQDERNKLRIKVWELEQKNRVLEELLQDADLNDK